MPKPGPKDIKVQRSAKTGRFVKASSAKKSPSTTYTQKISRTSKKKK